MAYGLASGLDLLVSAQKDSIITPPGEGQKSFPLCYLGTADAALYLARNAFTNTIEEAWVVCCYRAALCLTLCSVAQLVPR